MSPKSSPPQPNPHVELSLLPDNTSPPSPSPSPSVPPTPHERPLPSLPPTDTGYRAWLCLAGCFIANVLVWGFAFSFGVLQEFYSTHPPFASPTSSSFRPAAGIPAIGTTASGLMYLLMPVYMAVFQRWPHARRWSLWASPVLMAAALVGASFASSVGGLIVTQGVVYALAGNALVMPTITFLDEWFVRRKGLAIGIMWAGDGTGGVLMPLILQGLLGRVGFRWTLRVIAAIMVALTVPLLFFMQPRLPVPATRTSRPVSVSFIRTRLFWAFQLTMVIQGLGYFLPSNYLPTFAQSLGLSSTIGSVTVLMVNLTSILGCVVVGALVDRFDVMPILLGISVGAGLAILTIWGFSTTAAPLFVFSVLYGLFASSFSSAWGGMVKDMQKRHDNLDVNMMFGFLSAGRGIGSIISGPLSESLLENGKALRHGATSAYGSDYGPIIIFSGCTALASGTIWVVRRSGLI